MSQEVAHPSHYTHHPSGIECIKIVQEFPYNVGVAMAYCWRHQHKGQPVRDLEKAVQHLQFEVARLRGLDENRSRPYSAAVDGMRHHAGAPPPCAS